MNLNCDFYYKHYTEMIETFLDERYHFYTFEQFRHICADGNDKKIGWSYSDMILIVHFRRQLT